MPAMTKFNKHNYPFALSLSKTDWIIMDTDTDRGVEK